MNPMALIGRVIAGRYRLDALIGRGGFGAVYRGTQLPLGRRVAVKISLVQRPGLLARFAREARVQAEIRHPGCVFLLDYGQEPDGLVYLVQEFVDGPTLHQLLAAEYRLDPLRAVDLTLQVLDALDAAHGHGVVHRDIKPANVIITRNRNGREEVRVLDFGIAKDVSDDSDDTVTETGALMGTPKYMAPEQIRQREVGPPTDIYAVGAMLFCMLEGRPPFIGESHYDVIRQQIEAPVPPLSDDPLHLMPIVARAMAKDPAMRFATAGEMSAALAAALGPTTVPGGLSQPPVTSSLPPSDLTTTGGEPEDSAVSPAGRRARPWRKALLACALVAAGGSLMVSLLSRDEPLSAGARRDAAAMGAEADAYIAGPADVLVPDAEPPQSEDAAAPPADAGRPAPLDAGAPPRQASRRRSRPPAKQRPPLPATPRTPEEPIEAPPPSPPTAQPPRAAQEAVAPRAERSDDLERARSRIEQALDRCHCNWALSAIQDLKARDPVLARRLESRHVEQCQTAMPGVDNCLDRAREAYEEENRR